MKAQVPLRSFYIFWLAFVLLLAGCNGSGTPEGAAAWIDVPADNLSIPLGEALSIEGRATDPEGVAYVEIWINNELAWTLEDLSDDGTSVQFSHPWTPTEDGNYGIKAVAYGNGGEQSSSALVTIHVGGLPSDEPSTEVPATDVPATEERRPGAPSVEFYADPEGIQSGECTTLYWQVEGAQRVVLGSTEVSAQNTFEACPCQTTSYRLTVTDLEGVEDEFWVRVLVTGPCITPTPYVDETRPPIPLQIAPLEGAVITSSHTTLLWEAVTDESGIAEYRVKVERYLGGDVWEDIPGSVFYGITETQLYLNLDAGTTYRWRVRAIDGAGIRSNWSVWLTFSVP